MKKAVITTGGKQYIVTEGETISVERLKEPGKTVTFDTLLLIADGKTTVGTPLVSGTTVQATIVDNEARAEKVTAIRYKAKKRVHKLHGHKQHQTVLKIDSIA